MIPMRRPAAALLLSLSVFGFLAGESRGTDIEVVKEDGSSIKGELVAVRPTTLIVRQISSGAFLFLDVAEVTLVNLPKMSRGRALLSGLIQGLFTGVVVGDILSPKGATTGQRWLWWIGGGLTGGGIGAFLLGRVEVPTGDYETIPFRGRPKAEIDAVLARLRGLARISDFR